jgi:hypothetical protein
VNVENLILALLAAALMALTATATATAATTAAATAMVLAASAAPATLVVVVAGSRSHVHWEFRLALSFKDQNPFSLAAKAAVTLRLASRRPGLTACPVVPLDCLLAFGQATRSGRTLAARRQQAPCGPRAKTQPSGGKLIESPLRTKRIFGVFLSCALSPAVLR